jgi:hypothetical protein
MGDGKKTAGTVRIVGAVGTGKECSDGGFSHLLLTVTRDSFSDIMTSITIGEREYAP